MLWKGKKYYQDLCYHIHCNTFVLQKIIILNVRVSEKIEKELLRYCQDEGISKSMVVKEALAPTFPKKEKQEVPTKLEPIFLGRKEAVLKTSPFPIRIN